jgi:hypothetical protein
VFAMWTGIRLGEAGAMCFTQPQDA